MNKLKLLQNLYEEWENCNRCDLSQTRKRVVFGAGNPDADILIVGEAPGLEEDIKGRPFVGKSGVTLNKFFSAANLDRETDMFITNVVGCRPTMVVENDRTGASTIENRNPTKIERAACFPRLQQILYIVDPLLVITLGRVPYQALTGKALTMEKCRGVMHTITMRGMHTDVKYPLLPLFHPTFLDSTYNYRAEGPWGKTAKDFRLACDVIDRLREIYKEIPVPDRDAHIEQEDDEDED